MDTGSPATYRVTGQHAINVTSGYHAPGMTGVTLTEAEAAALTACGAVTTESAESAIAAGEATTPAGLPTHSAPSRPATTLSHKE